MTAATKAIPLEIIDYLAEYFSVMGEPMRLRILNLLQDGEKCVQDLTIASQSSQANVSKHLKVMLQAGILQRRTAGTTAYYSIADDLPFELSQLVWNHLSGRIEQQALQLRNYRLSP
jgi:DNA-binding transcriptional ArsR family regulator